jgi:2-polyprenyl-3-methyl-5-hydroxy-6-metoxy-1,4-benzoquinol methylase
LNRELTTTPLPDLEETYWWYRARKEIICDTVQRFLSRGSEILDFGAGSGVIAKQLVDLGYRVRAADVATEPLAACRQRALDTIDLNLDWPAAASADCVLACDVLEHVEDDVGLLRKLRVTLRPRGLLVVAVPAYDFLWSGEDYISKHVRRYTRSSLQTNLRTAGFDVEWGSYFNALLLPLISAALLYKRLLRPRDLYISDVQRLPEWQNEFLYKIFAAERLVLPRMHFPAGASVLLVARAEKS